MRTKKPQTFALLLLAIGLGATAGPIHAQGGSELVETGLLTPQAEAFQAALQAEIAVKPGRNSTDITQFYADRGFEPFWTGVGAGRADMLLAALEDSRAHGLPSYLHIAGGLGLPDDVGITRAANEIDATRAYLAFAGDLNSGVLAPSRVDPEIDVKTHRLVASDLLDRLAKSPVDKVLSALEPQDPEYRRLMAEKARLEAMLQSGSWGAPVPDGPTFHYGESGPRIGALRARLDRMGYPAPAIGPAASAFDQTLEQAVKDFQRAHGLNDDGVVGKRTIEAVNTSVKERWQQVAVNLERMRWTNRDPGSRYIVVNLPDFSGTLVENGEITWQSRTVVGLSQKHRTPEFTQVMRYLVVNPTWNVPASIAGKEYLPKLKRDPGALGKRNMRLLTRSGTEINPRLVDFSQFSSGNFPFLIKQKPGAGNALGKVKFMFPNKYSIYLHDTPSRSLFAKDARAFSHGCVRLERPLDLAHVLLKGQYSDPQATFDGWLAAKSERHVNLDRPLPVYIVYRTVSVDAGGSARYLNDIYGRDATVYRALKQAGVTLAAAQG
jgi:murein L,D-transpeptidase YcbB/YkuD